MGAACVKWGRRSFPAKKIQISVNSRNHDKPSIWRGLAAPQLQPPIKIFGQKDIEATVEAENMEVSHYCQVEHRGMKTVVTRPFSPRLSNGFRSMILTHAGGKSAKIHGDQRVTGGVPYFYDGETAGTPNSWLEFESDSAVTLPNLHYPRIGMRSVGIQVQPPLKTSGKYKRVSKWQTVKEEWSVLAALAPHQTTATVTRRHSQYTANGVQGLSL